VASSAAMARTRKPAPTLRDLQAALSPAPPQGPAFLRCSAALGEAGRGLVQRGEWDALLELRAWAWQHPLFMTEGAPLRGFLRQWEEALVSGAPLEVAATLVRDEVATATCDPWERLAARGAWSELRPLLRDDAAAWRVAEGRVLRGETLPGRSPLSGMPLRRERWEGWPELPTYSPLGMSWGSGVFAGSLASTVLPPAPAQLVCEPEWAHVVAPWAASEPRFVRVAGTGPQALACLLGEGGTPSVGACTWKEAHVVLMQAHGNAAPYLPGRGMVEARRALWRLLAAMAGAGWPVSGGALQAAMKGWQWSRYDPHEAYADAGMWSVFLTLEDPRRGLAWAAYAWVTD
jgi:hypothetical protein